MGLKTEIRGFIDKNSKTFTFKACLLFLGFFLLQFFSPLFLDITYQGFFKNLNSLFLNFILIGLILDYFFIKRNVWLLFLPIFCYGFYYSYSFYEYVTFTTLKLSQYSSETIVNYDPEKHELILDLHGISHDLIYTKNIPHYYRQYGNGSFEKFEYAEKTMCQNVKMAAKFENGDCLIVKDLKPDTTKIIIKIDKISFTRGLKYDHKEWYKNLKKHFQLLTDYYVINYNVGNDITEKTILYPDYLRLFPLTPLACGNFKILPPLGDIHRPRKGNLGYHWQKECTGYKNFSRRKQPILFRSPKPKNFDDILGTHIIDNISSSLKLKNR